tara:strand:+ start:37230 stop:37670 length:441 start_codon:yes stop_codon:yes gene_type:complete
MENATVQRMVTIGASVRTIDGALRRFKRSDTSDVLKAYHRIVCDAEIVQPTDHALLIYQLSQGVVVVPRGDVSRLRDLLEQGGSIDRYTCDGDIHMEAFDPAVHALLFRETSVVSYMENNPDHILGERAQVVAPTFKTALVWWMCE